MPALHRRGAVVVTVAFLLSTTFATLPTPVYGHYRELAGFSSFTITLVFSAFALGVLLALALAGHLSDLHGRRPLLAAALTAQVAAATVFVLADLLAGPASPSALLAGVLLARLLSGIGIGLLVPSANAALGELLGQRHGGAHRAASVAVVANLGGLAAGPLVGVGLLAVLDAPLRAPYALCGVLLAAAALTIALVPETRRPVGRRPRYRLQRPAVPREGAATFWALAATSCAAFAVFGSYAALAPRLMTDIFGTTSALVGSLPVALLFGCAATGQLLTARWTMTRRLVAAGALLCGGLALIAVTAVAAWLPGALVAAAITGTGVGLAFRSAVSGAAALAEPARRGAVTAAMLLVTYAGLSLPVVAVGALAQAVSATTTVVTLAAVVGVVVAITTTAATRVLAARAQTPAETGAGAAVPVRTTTPAAAVAIERDDERVSAPAA